MSLSKDGSTAVDLHPFDLLARLCALIPPPTPGPGVSPE